MSGCLKHFFWGFIILTCFFYALDYNEPKSTSPAASDIRKDNLDTTRAYSHYDFQKKRYLYMDELPKDSGRYKQGPPVPDLYVQEMQPSTRTVIYIREMKPGEKDQIVVVGDKRYRIRRKPNGDLQWIQIR